MSDNRAGGYGTITTLDHPFFVINPGDPTTAAKGNPFASAWCVFDGTVAGTNAPVAGYNVPSVTRVSTGVYTVNMSRPMLAANGAAIACANITTSGTVVSTNNVGGTSFTVRVTVAGTPTDSNEVKAVVFGG